MFNNHILNLAVMCNLEELQSYFVKKFLVDYQEEFRSVISRYSKYHFSEYLCSIEGRIFSLHALSFRIPHVKARGYLEFAFTKVTNNRRETHPMQADSFVASVFHSEQCNPTFEVHHKDFNPVNNHASNLEWLSREEHMAKHRSLFKRRILDDTMYNRQLFVEAMDKGIICQTCKSKPCRCILQEEVKEGNERVNEIAVPLGYPRVVLQNKRTGKYVDVEVHKLIAYTFLRDKFTEKKTIIDHINSDKNNNRLSNLRIVSPKENSTFALRVHVLSIHKETQEMSLTNLHVFYRDLPAKHKHGDKFYVDLA